MSLDKISFRFARGHSRVRLRELNGYDEQAVGGVDTASAINLLDLLLVPLSGSGEQPLKSASLTASDRDRLLAAVYERTYGPRIESTSRCALCDNLFDLSFSIEDLVSALDAHSSSPAAEMQPDGMFLMPDGARFRLPTGEDELAVLGLAPDEAARALLERCLIERKTDVDFSAVEEAMEEIAPVLDLDLDAECPECGGKQAVHFNVQFYLLRAIEQDRRRTAQEAHRLATAYGWSLKEIMSLPRSLRRTFTELIEAEMSARQRAFA